MVEGYRGIYVNDFTKSWTNGLAFLAILHRHRPDLVDLTRARKRPARENLKLAFDLAESVFGVTRLLDPEDFDVLVEPDELSILTYVSSLYDRFPHVPTLEQSLRDNERLLALEEYHDLASGLRAFLTDATADMLQRHFPTNLTDLKLVQQEFNRFRAEVVPPHLRAKQRLAQLFERAQDLSLGTADVITRDNMLHMDNLNRLWDRFALAQQERDLALQAELTRLVTLPFRPNSPG
jgi:plectin